ncbi:MAG: TRAP transporter small permease [Betaproteobacteria bacterium]|nr:TRAP transporter small permease [Betaproteobacteria bacterium]
MSAAPSPEPVSGSGVAARGAFERLEQLGLLATRGLSALGLAGLMGLALMTLFDGLARWLLNQPIEGVRDLAAVTVALAVTCCLPVGLMERSNISIRLASHLLGARMGKLLDAVASLLTAVVMAAFGWQFLVFAGKIAKANETTWILKIPTAPFWYGVCAIFAIAFVVQLVVVVLELARLAGRFEHSVRSGA